VVSPPVGSAGLHTSVAWVLACLRIRRSQGFYGVPGEELPVVTYRWDWKSAEKAVLIEKFGEG
jgi:hypothetical protein